MNKKRTTKNERIELEVIMTILMKNLVNSKIVACFSMTKNQIRVNITILKGSRMSYEMSILAKMSVATIISRVILSARLLRER